MDSKLISQLSEFGFSQNEAKAYLALLRSHPATGYEVSQHSGVPRSAIYDILKKLELSGFVSTEGEKPVYYSPIPPEQLATKLTSKFDHNIQGLRREISEVSLADSNETTWNIKGYKAMIDQARSQIDNASSSVYLSIWRREWEALEAQIKGAAERGIDIITFSFTEINQASGTLFSYGIEEEKLRNIWYRQIVLVTDKNKVLLGGADQSLENRSILTDNPAILRIAINYIILDLTLFSQRRGVPVNGEISKMMDGHSKELESLF